MPRAPRRGVPQRDDRDATTPTRPERNEITATIPPFMLDTPPHAPFVNAPSYNPATSIVPSQDARDTQDRHARQRAARTRETRTDQPADGSQASTHALSLTSDTVEQAEQSYVELGQQETDDAQVLNGLRDISSLATWTLSSAKPGCALAQLRNPSTNLFWQSDGPQPHTLTLHFFKLVAIVKMRIYLDFDLDESYTPTRMKFYAGMSEGGLVEFGEWAVCDFQDPETGETRSQVENVKGWIDVDLNGVGGREKRYFEVAEDEERMAEEKENAAPAEEAKTGSVLKAMVVQVFSRDEAVKREIEKSSKQKEKKKKDAVDPDEDGDDILAVRLASWMRTPDLR